MLKITVTIGLYSNAAVFIPFPPLALPPMRLRYATLRFLLSSLVLSLFALALSPLPAAAQIELNEDGNVGMGDIPDESYKLKVEDRGSLSGITRGGIRGSIFVENGFSASGLRGRSFGAALSYGVRAEGRGENSSYGVYAEARGGSTASYGVYAKATNYDSGNNYGVYGTTTGGDNEYAGYFSGNLTYTGNLTDASDRKFKRDIRGLGRGLSGDMEERVRGFSSNAPGQQTQGGSAPGQEGRQSEAHAKLLQLQPRTYQYRTSEYEGMGFSEGKQFGLVAQEVEEVFPELVSEAVHPGTEELNEEGEIIGVGDPTTYKSVNYVQLVPIMIQTIREQQAEIDMLKKALREQEIRVE